ncbi:D-sedoheptulose 7-phosphate isomerase [Rhizobium sp. BK226]|uniref:D-sedoheptulose 7-phosphate isomerase n=1 Tax=Rhizobium sp. BK226 TaxID=2587075 RepID=UPI0016140E7B|nr:D-sedoheptulose 7-phosphate isomerase [Rhizobium sp. BK226]MBB4116330.1 D-sedoheptulose 7-phosphate isomerase [Rhizobium sp. BK226]
MTAFNLISKAIDDHQAAVSALSTMVPQIEALAVRLKQSLTDGGKLILMGNGGSAADSQHIAAELVGRFKRERRGLPAIALTTDTSILTAVGNDYGFENVFSRQVEALCGPKDVLIGISTSGNSGNVVRAIETGKQMGIYCVGLLGSTGGKLASLCDMNIVVPVAETARVQELHILVGHILCELLELDE